ncbi:MAG TPA: hypothetical protein VN376_06860 [Longilinea sp.]|nr:hypothetical protein [Longilinea sp.]
MTEQKGSLFSKEIAIPKALRELHGERTRVSTLGLVYLSGLICAGLVTWQLWLAAVPLWQTAVSALIFLDVGGGVAANLSSSTNQYYQQHAKLRLPFIALHVFHPAVMAALFPAALPYFVFVMLFTLTATFTVNALTDAEQQQNLAALLLTVGCALSFFFHLPVPVLFLFAPLFMVKLILGFAVRRPLFTNTP